MLPPTVSTVGGSTTICMSNQKIYSLYDCRALLSMYGQLKHCHSTKILKYISEKINMDMVHKVASENRDTTKIKVL